MMKQLKFFTNHADTLKATQDELAKRGISPENLHIFTKENIKHRFDGLIVKSQKKQDAAKLHNQVILNVFVTFLLMILLFGGIISFFTLALLVFGVSILNPVFKKIKRFRRTNGEHFKKVYFLVVDVDDTEMDVVQRVTRNHPDLLAQ